MALKQRSSKIFDLGTYIASKEDLEAVEEGIEYVWHPKLDFIFKDKSKINKTAVISYDSRYIYLWKKGKFTKIPHKLKINKKFYSYWRAGLEPREIEKYLPNSIKKKTRFEVPIISGGLLKPFIELQKQKKRPNNPYVTRESYLATIVHEFGHVYWNQHKLWWYSNKKENLSYLNYALKVFKGDMIKKTPLKVPSPVGLGEVFAFCTEYFVSKLFFPKHKSNLDKFYSSWIKKLIESEQDKNLDKEDSVLDTQPYHDLAAVFGILLLNCYPKTWSEKILRPILLIKV